MRVTWTRPSCTESVHVGTVCHAPEPCNIPGGCDARHARVGVQHNRPHLAPQPCNIPCTPVGATQDNRYRTTNPDMHSVQVGSHPLPNFTMTHLAQPSHVGNQQTARAEKGAAA